MENSYMDPIWPSHSLVPVQLLLQKIMTLISDRIDANRDNDQEVWEWYQLTTKRFSMKRTGNAAARI